MCDALRLYFRPEDARITSQNHYLYFSLIFAPVAELADALDLGSSSHECRFDSCRPHQWFHGVVVNMPVCHTGDRGFKSRWNRH